MHLVYYTYHQLVRGKIHNDVERIREREKWFMKARKALRWHNGPIPLSTQTRWSNRELSSAQKGIDDFLTEIEAARTMKQSRALVSGLDIIEKRFIKYREPARTKCPDRNSSWEEDHQSEPIMEWSRISEDVEGTPEGCGEIRMWSPSYNAKGLDCCSCRIWTYLSTWKRCSVHGN
jgi:hypothetical protein